MTGDGHFERGRWIPRITPPEPTEADLLRANIADLRYENSKLTRILSDFETRGIRLDSVEIVAEVTDGEEPGVTVTMITGPPDSITLVSNDRLPFFAEVEDHCCGPVRQRKTVPFDPYPIRPRAPW